MFEMNTFEIIKMILDINEKFAKVSDGSEDKVYYEVLHTSLSSLIRTITEEEYLSIPKPYRDTIEKLRGLISRYVSMEYKEEIEKYESEHGLFKIAPKKKSSPRIGFVNTEVNDLNV